MTLNPRQRSFVEHFLSTGNATESAKLAGYSPKTAAQQGFALLRNPNVTQAINELERQRSHRLRLSQDFELLKALEILEYAMEDKKRYTQKGEPMVDPATGEYVTVKDTNAALNALNLIAKMRGKFLTDIINANPQLIQGRPLADWTKDELSKLKLETLPPEEKQIVELSQSLSEVMNVN